MKYLSVSFGVLGFLLTGCGSDSSSPQAEPEAVVATTDEPQSNGLTLAVNAMAELPACNEETKGQTYFVKEQKAIYACLETEWEVAIEGERQSVFVSCNIPPIQNIVAEGDYIIFDSVEFYVTNNFFTIGAQGFYYIGISGFDTFSQYISAPLSAADEEDKPRDFSSFPESVRSVVDENSIFIAVRPYITIAINAMTKAYHVFGPSTSEYPLLSQGSCETL